MIEAALWVVIVLDILLFGVVPVLFGLFAKCWWNVRRTRGHIVAEIWEPNGDTPRTLVKPDPTGTTIVITFLSHQSNYELGHGNMTTRSQ